MRVADKMSYRQVNDGLHKNRADMHRLQNQAATQKKVTKPSDDPVAATRVLQQRTEIQGLQQFMKNITSAKAFMEFSEQSLGELTEVLVRAKELALSQAGDTSANEETRRVIATEIEQLYHQAVQIANRKLGDRFLFGGFRTTQPPFDPNGKYRGDHGVMRIPIDKEAKVSINIPGSRIFLGMELKTPEPSAAPVNKPTSELPPPRRDELNSIEMQPVRGPASIDQAEEQTATGTSYAWKSSGSNIFDIMSSLHTSLMANDKAGIQESLDRIDEGIAQVILSRSDYGSRLTTLDKTLETLQRGEVDAKAVASQAEDADIFELVTDINKAENTLQASLQTSGKLLQPSLLDFLK